MLPEQRRGLGSSMRAHRRIFFEAYGDGPHDCVFCGAMVEGDLNVHHEDGDKSNNVPENLKPSHRSCHSRFHNYGNEHTKGRRQSREHRAKTSLRHRGKVVTPETREKLRVAMLGRQHRLGLKHSEATKKKISESVKRYRNKGAQ